MARSVIPALRATWNHHSKKGKKMAKSTSVLFASAYNGHDAAMDQTIRAKAGDVVEVSTEKLKQLQADFPGLVSVEKEAAEKPAEKPAAVKP